MTNKEYFKKLIDVERTQENHNDFYELAEKYGFSTPWCESLVECSSEGRSITG